MRPGDPLLDTNALVAWMHDIPAIIQRYRGRDVLVSAVSVGELWYGAWKSRQRIENGGRISRVLRYADILMVDQPVAERYGQLKQQLRAIGNPIPDNGLWIAATAVEHGLVLVTRDRHFGVVAGLAMTGW